jgi:hypothetical protein
MTSSRNRDEIKKFKMLTTLQEIVEPKLKKLNIVLMMILLWVDQVAKVEEFGSTQTFNYIS